SRDEPVPMPERHEPGDHVRVRAHDRSRQPETPVVGTVGRRGGGALPSPLLGSPPNAALAISAMPASEPSTLVDSIGRISTFWFGDSASWPNALRYLSAMK